MKEVHLNQREAFSCTFPPSPHLYVTPPHSPSRSAPLCQALGKSRQGGPVWQRRTPWCEGAWKLGWTGHVFALDRLISWHSLHCHLKNMYSWFIEKRWGEILHLWKLRIRLSPLPVLSPQPCCPRIPSFSPLPLLASQAPCPFSADQFRSFQASVCRFAHPHPLLNTAASMSKAINARDEYFICSEQTKDTTLTRILSAWTENDFFILITCSYLR